MPLCSQSTVKMKTVFLCVLLLSFLGTSYTDCPKPSVKKKTIIKSESSIQNGASLLKHFEVQSARDCYKECCQIQSCNVAVMQYKEEYTFDGETIKKMCFLFDCGNPSVCSFEAHSRYAIIEIEKPKKTQTEPTMVTSPYKSTVPKIEVTSAIATVKSTITITTTISRDSNIKAQQKCPPGTPVTMCSNNPCDNKKCHSNPNAVCRPNFCGGCFAKFYDVKGNLLQCEEKTVNNKNHVEDVQVASVHYEQNPTDSLPGPVQNKVNPTEDPYFNSERRTWIDATEPGQLINTTKETTENSIVDRLPTETKIVVNQSFGSLPLLVALIVSLILIIGLIYRFRCYRRGKPKKLPVDDGDYLINGMYL